MNANRSSRRNIFILGAAAVLVAVVTVGGLVLANQGDGGNGRPASVFAGGRLRTATVAPQTQKTANDSIVAAAAAKGRVRVLVQVAAQISPNASAQDQARAVANAQDNVLATIGGSATVITRMQRLPLMTVEVDEAGARALVGSAGVISVMEDIPEPPSLADSVPLIGAPAVYGKGVSGKGWAVAILDTGADTSHPFFGGRVQAEACFSSTYAAGNMLSNCPNGADEQLGKGAATGCPRTYEGCDHGTHVTGIAAGSGAGGSGVAKDATILAVQVFSQTTKGCSQGKPGCTSSYPSDQVRGLEWVLENAEKYHIASVNISIGGGTKYTDQDTCDAANGPRKAAIDALAAANVAVVIAAGNESYTDGLGAPGCISSAIAVGSTTKQDGVSDFSNSNELLDLLAPGQGILSSIPGGGYGTKNGTSMAAPHVAGAFALLRSGKPEATVAEIYDALSRTGKQVRDGRNALTRPRIQVDKAYQYLTGDRRPGATPTPAAKPAPRPIGGGGVRNDDQNNPVPMTVPYFKDQVDVRNATIGDDPTVYPTPYCTEGGRFDHTVWYSFTAPSDGYMVVSTEGSNYDTIMTVWLGSRGGPIQVGCMDDDRWPGVLTSTIGGWVTAGTSFRIQVGAWDDGGTLVFQSWFKADNGAAAHTNTGLAPLSFEQGLQGKPSDLAASVVSPAVDVATAACGSKRSRPQDLRGDCYGEAAPTKR